MSGTVCFYCSVALQSWISQEPVGICWFLVSKVKENMWTLRSFSHCRERKERKRAHLDVNLSSRKGSTCRRDRTYPYELSFYPHECSALLLNVVKTKQDKTKKQRKNKTKPPYAFVRVPAAAIRKLWVVPLLHSLRLLIHWCTGQGDSDLPLSFSSCWTFPKC